MQGKTRVEKKDTTGLHFEGSFVEIDSPVSGTFHEKGKHMFGPYTTKN